MTTEGRHIDVRGTVQGVGFRPWVSRLAHELGVAGRVRNDPVGVAIDVFGPTSSLDSFVARLIAGGPPASEIHKVTWRPIASDAPAPPAGEFVIEPSEAAGERRVAIPADLAVCPACRAEVDDPTDRRHGYPFTNCTECGPRYTIASGIPYDRAATTMASFVMCPDCTREYESIHDRRFHAQPNACPRCGPRLTFLDGGGREVATPDPLGAAVGALEDGLIVAIKGLGGYHLACDATRGDVVRRLRERKHREAKPFAVMVRDLQEARYLAKISADEAALLSSVQRPIVLCARHPGAPICEEVAPETPLLGLFLPYTPLHHLLLARFDRPIVLTSGNRADEPIAFQDDDARERLRGIADRFLVHDREIAARCDDSVARVIAGAPVILRRARGWVPQAIALGQPVVAPILACGADLKNAVCLAVGDLAVPGPHVGDVEHLEAMRALADSARRLEQFLGVRPEIVAHDLHPGYHSTAYALARGEPIKIAVQHHHAHVAAAMAEHGLSGPVLGLAWDGTGFGPDGTSWGGELLLASYTGFERLATFRPLPLPGGDQAVRQVWRLALAALDEAFPRSSPPLDRFPVFNGVTSIRVRALRRLVAAHLNTPLAHGVGRWFDAVGALVLGQATSRYEGDVAVRLNMIADPDERRPYPIAIEAGALTEIDLRPTVRAIYGDLLAHRSPGTIAGRFHETLVEAGLAIVHAAARQRARLPVVLTGGCFQNARLAGDLAAGLTASGFRVYLHRRVPPNDGGIALGQAVIADARVRSGACA